MTLQEALPVSRNSSAPEQQATDDRRVVGQPQILFDPGRILGTPGAIAALQESGPTGGHLLARHLTGDWGNIGQEDAQANEVALKVGERILSAHTLYNGRKIWIITEADRRVTTILLPEDY